MGKKSFTVGSLIAFSTILEKGEPTVSTDGQSSLHTIIVMQNGMKFTISPGKGKLLDNALSQGKALNYKCRKGTCGLCKVNIIAGASRLRTPNEKEQHKLRNALNEGFRLACQAEMI